MWMTSKGTANAAGGIATISTTKGPRPTIARPAASAATTSNSEKTSGFDASPPASLGGTRPLASAKRPPTRANASCSASGARSRGKTAWTTSVPAIFATAAAAAAVATATSAGTRARVAAAVAGTRRTRRTAAATAAGTTGTTSVSPPAAAKIARSGAPAPVSAIAPSNSTATPRRSQRSKREPASVSGGYLEQRGRECYVVRSEVACSIISRGYGLIGGCQAKYAQDFFVRMHYWGGRDQFGPYRVDNARLLKL
ncbi:hypothetical protein ACHAWF_013234 [Thalassiosira exigua]